MKLRNIAIIAHVDHGKTTLVDELLRQSGSFRTNQQVDERAMDTNDLERERGITILAKCTSVVWDQFRINIVDTPGHADFGGEVERILTMVDGVLLLVDAAEGPMPQTKFVTAKALRLGLRPIVMVNKVDKPESRAFEVQDEVFDLFSALDANDQQLDFQTIFGSAKQGWAALLPDGPKDNMSVLFGQIIDLVPEPTAIADAPFSMLATTLEADPYLGRILTGRIASGVVCANDTVQALNIEGTSIEKTRITKVLAFRGLNREPVERAEAGDIITIAGFTKATVADTLCGLQVIGAIAADPIDPPTLAMTFSINDSPLGGRDGKKVTTRMIRTRLLREAESNVAIKITEATNTDAFEVAGRGELQLGVLIEQMRREGFELSISRPRVLYRNDPETGERQEPFEEVQIDVDEDFSGVVVESMSLRKGRMTELRPSGGGKVRITFLAPSRGMIGYHGEFLTETRGTGIMSRLFHGYDSYQGPITGRRNGVLVAIGQGKTVAYALDSLEGRGPLFVGAGVEVYTGMIIGEHSRGNDLEVNPLKAKQLTNTRASGKDDAVQLTPPRRVSLEQAISYIEDDELVEVTPNFLRMRKRHLDPNERKKASREFEAES